MTDFLIVAAIALVITALAVITLGIGNILRSWMIDFDSDMDDHERDINECLQRLDSLEMRIRELETSEAIMRFEVIRREFDERRP
jgi:hypothetical protein